MLDRTAQVDQFAVEEMAGVGHAHQLGGLFQGVQPVVDRLRFDDLIGIAWITNHCAGGCISLKSQRPAGGAIEISTCGAMDPAARSDT